MSMYVPGIESQWWRNFRTHPDWFRGQPRFLCSGYRVSFLGIKRLESGINHPLHSRTEVVERVEQYFYSPSGPT
jgi:hypothetical protein